MNLNAIDLNGLIKREQGIFFVPYSKSHPSEMNIEMPELRVNAAGVDIGDILAAQSNSGVCATVIWNTRPVAIFGSVNMWHGVHESWAVIDNYARQRPKQMLKIGRQFMDIIKHHYSLHRQQIYVRSDDMRAVRYAEALGFISEGLMSKYTADQCDSYLMARF
jgi:hypothetical protein